MSLVNSKVLLVGSARGIGFSVLEYLLQAGAQVMAADCEWQLLLEQSESLLGALSGPAHFKKTRLSRA